MCVVCRQRAWSSQFSFKSTVPGLHLAADQSMAADTSLWRLLLLLLHTYLLCVMRGRLSWILMELVFVFVVMLFYLQKVETENRERERRSERDKRDVITEIRPQSHTHKQVVSIISAWTLQRERERERERY